MYNLQLLNINSRRKKTEAKHLDSTTPTEDSSLMDPASVSVIGVVVEISSTQSPALPPDKDKATFKTKKPVEFTSSTDSNITELDQKWSDWFNRLEALIMTKSFQPTFSSDVRVTPSHSPQANVARDTGSY